MGEDLIFQFPRHLETQGLGHVVHVAVGHTRHLGDASLDLVGTIGAVDPIKDPFVVFFSFFWLDILTLEGVKIEQATVGLVLQDHSGLQFIHFLFHLGEDLIFLFPRHLETQGLSHVVHVAVGHTRHLGDASFDLAGTVCAVNPIEDPFVLLFIFFHKYLLLNELNEFLYHPTKV